MKDRTDGKKSVIGNISLLSLLPRVLGREVVIMSNPVEVKKSELKTRESLVKSFGVYMGKLATARQQMGRIFLDLSKLTGKQQACDILAKEHGFTFEKSIGRKLTLDTLKMLASEYQDLSANGGFAHGIHVVTGLEFDTLNLSVSDSQEVRDAIKSGLVKVSDLKRYVKLASEDSQQAHDNLLSFVTSQRAKKLSPKVELTAGEKIQRDIDLLRSKISDKQAKAEKLIDECAELEKQVIALQANLSGLNDDSSDALPEEPVIHSISMGLDPEPAEPVKPVVPANLAPRKRDNSKKVIVNDATAYPNVAPLQASGM
jgi:hypothetical protein